MRVAAAILAALLAPAAHAQDDIAALKGATIVYAGVFETLDCPFARRFNCLTWPTDLLRTKDRTVCFSTSAAQSCQGLCQGMLASFPDRSVAIFVVDRGGITRGDVRPAHCPGAL
ncbi:MAG TPA: hypothetical protein VMU47_07320 [Caldimonas sp.]|nr:hypothetical protein [Caldimonas sp.]